MLGSPISRRTARRQYRFRGRTSTAVGAVIALCAGLLVAGQAASAAASTATGEDVPVWANGWSWTYATTFKYNDGNGTNATLNESVTYTNAGRVTFRGQDAYRLNISGRITGGGGNANAGSAGNVGLKDFSGSVTGTRYVRASDLALLQEHQEQHLDATANKVIDIDVTADINLTLTPEPGWRTHDFPLNAGDSWHNDESIAYTGGFSYDSSLASGSSPFNGTFEVEGLSRVSNETITAAGGSVATKRINASASTPDGTVVDNIWWSAAHKNDAKEHMELPLDGAKLTIDRTLSAASTPAPAKTLTATITPSLTCAGGQVTVAGKVGNTSGVGVAVTLDKSPIDPGQKVTANTTTTANGNYSTTIRVPSESDGLGKNGSRANWGVLVSGGGATDAATLVVTAKDCATLAYTGDTSAPRGTEATARAKLTNLAGGSVAGRTVTFAIPGGGSVEAVTNASGIATAALPVGDEVRTTAVTASFSGTSTMEAAEDSASFAVDKVGTSTTVAPSLDSVESGEPVTFVADVASTLAGAGTPSGTVQFKVDGADFGGPVELAGGSATSAEITTLALGEHTVQAVYAGSGDFTGSSSAPVAFEVTPPRAASATSLTASPTAAVYGQEVTLSAGVTGTEGGPAPTGSVTFRQGSDVLGTGTLDAHGSASVTTTALPVGSSAITATYSGDEAYKSSSSAPRTVTVDKAAVAVALDSADTTSVTGEAVRLTVTVAAEAPGSGTPSGTVRLLVDGQEAGSAVTLDGGAATFVPLSDLGAGTHVLAVRYDGDAGFAGGTDSVEQQVAQADTTTVLTSSRVTANEGEPVELTAHVVAVAPGSGAPTGTVTFTAGGATIGAAELTAADGGSTATLTVDNLAPGDHEIVAGYPGDDDYTASTSPALTQTVIEAAAVVGTTTTVTSSQNPSTYGQLISFTAQVETEDGSAPRGAVQFSLDGHEFGDPVPVDADGVAESLGLGSPMPGDHTVIATFRAEAGFSGSGAMAVQTVVAAGVRVALRSSDAESDPGQAVTFSAEVTPTRSGTGHPTGFVQFRVDGTALGDAVPLDGGTATSPSISSLAPGEHEVTALYSGDVHFVSAPAVLTQRVVRIGTTTELSAPATTPTYGEKVVLEATVSPADGGLGAPEGTVTFTDGDTTLGVVPVTRSDGVATARLTVPGLHAGDHAVRAAYSGSPNHAPSASAATSVRVAKLPTTIAADPAVVRLFPLGLPLGRLRVTVGSPLGPVAGAPVDFRVGSKVVCTTTTDASGVATCNAIGQLLGLVLFNGYHASYAGDPDQLSSTAHGVVLK